MLLIYIINNMNLQSFAPPYNVGKHSGLSNTAGL